MSRARSNFKNRFVVSTKQALKKTANKKRLSQIGRVGLAFIMLIIVVFVLYLIKVNLNSLQSVEFSREYKEGFAEDDKDVEYHDGDIFTLLIITTEKGENEKLKINGFELIKVDPESDSALIATIPAEIYFVPNAYSEKTEVNFDSDLVRIRDLMVLGNLNNPPKPLSYTYYQIEELFAIPLNGYVFVDGDDADGLSKLSRVDSQESYTASSKGYEAWSDSWNKYWIDYINKLSLIKVWSNKDVLGHITSNMSAGELYRFVKAFQSIAPSNYHIINITDDELEEVVNDRGEHVNMITESAIDKALEGSCSNIELDREQARIEILNGSQINGLGGRYERLIKHVGGDVIRVENAPGKKERTVIYVTDFEEFPKTLDKIEKLWDGDIEVIEGRPDFITTGDIIVILGMDFLEH